MDDLRSEIRAAFNREQAVHPPAAALRRNVVDAVTTQTRREPELQWVAVVAAVILGVLVVAGLMSTRFAHKSSVPASIPKADYGPPPAGVPLLYVHDPNNQSWYIGYDWSGKPRGTVKLSQPLGPGESVGMSPDGQQFQVLTGGKGGSGLFLDRLGHLVPNTIQSSGFSGGIWGDDNRHVCSTSVDQQTFVWRFAIQLPGEVPRSVAVIARDPGLGQTGINVVACSVHNDRAILVRTSIAWASELWVVSISNGKVLSHHTLAANLQMNVVASRDGAYIAENPGVTDLTVTPPGPVLTRILRVSDWTQVAHVGNLMVLAFSGDDSLVLLANMPPGTVKTPVLKAEDWKSGSTVWDGIGTDAFGVVAQPGGRDFALALATPGPDGRTATIEIIHGDGSVTTFPRRYEATW